VQVVPIGFSVHEVPLQMFGATQSVADVAAVQVVRHAPAVMSQVYFPHGVDVAGLQTPGPLHTRADAAVVALVQVAPAHGVPLTCFRQRLLRSLFQSR